MLYIIRGTYTQTGAPAYLEVERDTEAGARAEAASFGIQPSTIQELSPQEFAAMAICKSALIRRPINTIAMGVFCGILAAAFVIAAAWFVVGVVSGVQEHNEKASRGVFN